MFGVKYRYIFILLLAAYSFLNILFTEGDKLFGFVLNPFLFFGILLCIVFLIWEGNRVLSAFAMKWQFRKFHPLFVLFGLSLIIVLFIAFLVTLGFEIFKGASINEILTFKLALGFAFRVNLFLHSINAIVFFVNQYKNAQLETERLKKQNAEARFEALRNQINPHFLFNSFNVLSSLVHKDADTSSRFIEQLSNVYRYLLYNQENKVVRLWEELTFIESYIFLLKMRFKDNLNIVNTIDEKHKSKYIAPATMQLLIENAIKHNIVSRAEPLTIKLHSNNDYLIVENNVQLKPVKEPSTQLGLKNIRERYDYLCGKDALIVQSNGHFIVKVPLIEIE